MRFDVTVLLFVIMIHRCCFGIIGPWALVRNLCKSCTPDSVWLNTTYDNCISFQYVTSVSSPCSYLYELTLNYSVNNSFYPRYISSQQKIRGTLLQSCRDQILESFNNLSHSYAPHPLYTWVIK
jgi:hypothetical protein